VRLSTPLFSMPPVTQPVQKPTESVASQREGGGIKTSQLRGLQNSIDQLSTLKLVGEYLIGTLNNGKTISVPKNLSRTEMERELRRQVKLRLHHNEVPTLVHAHP
jgi:hypothetical protein